MGRFKKGDWVRVLDRGGDPDVFTDGQICQVTGVDGLLVYCGDGAMYPHRFEPWQPKVGERVRYVANYGSLAAGKEAEVIDITTRGIKVRQVISGTVNTESLSSLEPTIDAPAAPLTIAAGRYYKTRDGRKVGPMEASDHVYWNTVVKWTFDCKGWYADGNYLTDGEHPNDLIAEWVDTAATPTVRGNTAAQVDTIADEYGPVVAKEPKFKVGDLIRRTSVGDELSQVGYLYVVEDGDDYPEGEFELVSRPSESTTSTFTMTIDTTELHQELDDIIVKLKKIKKLRAKLAA